MVNVNIINNLIGGISKQIPLVHSYYTTSPYESWNTKEIQYGSVSFVVTKVNTRETTTTFDATIYYGDRLLEDNSNRDSVHSDAATVIQTIVGALNTADEYLEVSYPVGITLFEQDFEDAIAGGWAQLSISAEGMGECFEDDFSVPEIIATSAYYTKDEINQLFPLKTELSTVAFTGSFNDLKDTPDLVIKSQFNSVQNELNNVKDILDNTPTKQDFDNLTQAVVDSTGSLAGELEKKVNVTYFDEWADGIEADLATRPTKQGVDAIKQDITTQIGVLKTDINNKVDSTYFEGWKSQTDTTLNNKATQQSVGILRQDLTDQIVNINRNLDNKVGSGYFETWKSQTENTLKEKASTQSVNQLTNELDTVKNDLQKQINTKVTESEVRAIINESSIEDFATKEELNSLELKVDNNNKLTQDALDTKVSTGAFEAFKESVRVHNQGTVDKQEFDNLTEAVAQSTSFLAAELDKKVNVAYFDPWADGIEADLSEKISRQTFDNTIANIYKKSETYSKSEVDKKLDNVVIEGDINLSNYYTKDEVDDIISNIDISGIDLSDYAMKTDVYTKTQTYSRAQIDAKLEDISNVDVDLSDYPTKAELEASYYTKSEIDDKLDEIGTGGTVDLSNYYNKSETYSKSEIDATIGNINTILNDVLYTL